MKSLRLWAVCGLAIACLAAMVYVSRLASAKASAHSEAATQVSVRVFDADGALAAPATRAGVIKTVQEWKDQLDDLSFNILREDGTERAGTSPLLKEKRDGVFVCKGCRLPLFDSTAKFDSGTGWPSFYEPVARENVTDKPDHSHGMVRVENECTRCGGHLGHVFDDGPRPTGLRFCINGAAIEFVPRDQIAKTLAEKPDAEPTTQGK